jgi:hypothetical protein
MTEGRDLTFFHVIPGQTRYTRKVGCGHAAGVNFDGLPDTGAHLTRLKMCLPK